VLFCQALANGCEKSDIISRVTSSGKVKFLWDYIVSGALYEIMELVFLLSFHLFLWKLDTMNAVA
jgi:hypothetical protein